MKKVLSKISISIFLTFIVLLVTMIALPCASVQAATSDPECWAVIIGIEDYQNLSITWDYGDKDAEDLSQALSPTWGSNHIRLLTNSQATKAAILNAIDWLADNAGPDDTVLFFFSGGGGTRIWPYNSLATSATNDITGAELGNAFDSVDSHKIAFIFGFWEASGIRDSLAETGRIIIFAGGASDIIWYSNTFQHNIFSYYLLEAIDNFDDTDANNDYEISIEEIFDSAKLETQTFSVLQNPVMTDRSSGEIGILSKFIFKTNTTLPTGSTVLTLDGTGTTSQSLERLWVPGSSHTVSVEPFIYAGDDTRYEFTGWGDGQSSNSRTITKGYYGVNYQKEYKLQVESSFGSPQGSGWYKQGSQASFSVTSYLETTDTKHYFTGWSGDYIGTSASGTLTMSAPKTITAGWRHEYLLTINSVYGAPTGAGWYAEGVKAKISVEDTQGFIIRQIFTGWSGDINTTQASYEITMNAPYEITANWRTDYIQLYILIAIVVVVGGGIATTVILLARRGGKPTTTL